MKPVLESYNRIQIFIWRNCNGLKSTVRLEQRVYGNLQMCLREIMFCSKETSGIISKQR